MFFCGDVDESETGTSRPSARRGQDSFDLRAAVQLPELTNRRTQDDVRRLVYRFKQRIEDVPGARERLLHFWRDADFQDSVLATLAHDIPRDGDPLAGAQEKTSGERESRNPKSRRRKFQERTYGDCVLWLGLVNKHNKYAALELKLPETFDPWVTYVNRLMVYLFAEIPGYRGPDDFHRLLDVSMDEPFPMKCHNPVCVCLNHIDWRLRRPKESADSEEDETDGDE
ncbi:hypothetical protein TGPRC2_306980 [Toxoplasma gondii TgCatPRC2]|uniref:Uncharacterized protein n=1 Tax=Toxoplasma gondii TgCatPRC2 TaxID=1130821 RepID=A0A151GZW6_TOXGO|nr:hypothetical protein TGPRC2_306980 [Toxoplasma gondii TgCatPRC2]